VFQRYRAVFRVPGSAAFCAASFVLRMPIAIYPIGIVLIISAREGRYGFAGLLSACYIFGNAVGTPLLSVLVDRFGQRRVILPATAVHAAATLSVALLLRADAPNAALVAPTVLFGAAYPPVSSLVRARWSHQLAGRPELATALSVESVLDELIFVIGPLVATLLATQATPVLVLYLALALVGAGSLWLAALRATEPPVHPHGTGERTSALRMRGMPVLTIATVGMGATFASAEVAMVAYCGQHGHRGLSGLVLAGLALGSGVAGLVYGAVAWHSPVLDRFRVQALVFAALPMTLLAAVDVPVLAITGFLVGLGIAPLLITTFGLIHEIVPARALTEGMSWVSTGLNFGYGAGAALVGGIADAHGARTAFLMVIGAALTVGVFGLVLPVRLRADRSVTPGQAGAAVAPASPNR
jgi:MFS family permease